MPAIDFALSQDGPIISVGIYLSVARMLALQKEGAKTGTKVALPKPFVGRGLIDTGASGTVIDKAVAAVLGLVPTGSTLVHTPSTGTTPHQASCYDISIWFVSQSPSSAQPASKSHMVHPSHVTLPVMEADFSTQRIDALIGRDILAHCLLVYDGPNKRVVLTYGEPVGPTQGK
jgi:hypothetical protein